jgi:hypothetical protein
MTYIESRPRYPRTAEIKRLFQAVEACGISVGSVRIRPDGTIELAAASDQPLSADNDFDRLHAAGLL